MAGVMRDIEARSDDHPHEVWQAVGVHLGHERRSIHLDRSRT
jgi:hypothetical protein